MRNTLPYKLLTQQVAAKELTLEQLKAASPSDLVSMIGTASFTQTFKNNMKTCIVQDAERAAREKLLEEFIEQFTGGSRVWLTNLYPNVSFEIIEEEGQEVIKVWLKGKPEPVEPPKLPKAIGAMK